MITENDRDWVAVTSVSGYSFYLPLT